MREFNRIHPVVLMVYYVCVIALFLISANPIISIICLITGLLICCLTNETRCRPKELLAYLVTIIVITVVNPLISHAGVTPMFFLNSNPITLEATLYGLYTGITIVGILLWCRAMSHSMSSDKIMYLLGKPFPRIALLISMSLRFVPLLKRRTREMYDVQKSLGQYSGESFTIRFRESVVLFSSIIGWSMENAIETSNYMQIKGYGSGKRTSYSDYCFKAVDGAILIAVLLLFGVALFMTISGNVAVVFYPQMCFNGGTLETAFATGSISALCVLPEIITLGDSIRWKYCMRRI